MEFIQLTELSQKIKKYQVLVSRSQEWDFKTIWTIADTDSSIYSSKSLTLGKLNQCHWVPSSVVVLHFVDKDDIIIELQDFQTFFWTFMMCVAAFL